MSVITWQGQGCAHKQNTHTRALGVIYLAAGCAEEVAVRMVSLKLELRTMLCVYKQMSACVCVSF